MKVYLGCGSCLVALAFEAGLFLCMAKVAWSPSEEVNGLLGFIGFALPLALLAFGTWMLWADAPHLRRLSGWLCATSGLIWALGLLAVVTDWVKLVRLSSRSIGFWEGVGIALGFGLPMLVCGAVGLLILEREEHNPW
jgi:hypothetical protein